jgi:hypothetical protein
MLMKLQLKGQAVNSPASITVMINGQQVFSGAMDTDRQLEEITYYEYEHGAQTETGIKKTDKITITVVTGSIKVGSALFWIDDFMPVVPGFYAPQKYQRHEPGTDLDHRKNILINNAPPNWPILAPEDPTPGTPENPDWNGWNFDLNLGDHITFDIVFPNWPKNEKLPFCLGDEQGQNIQWYNADGNKIDSDPLGEDFWIARQNQVDQ